MDDHQGGLLLIATSMIVLVAFAITVLAVMLIYRKRKLQHISEIGHMNKRFHDDLLQARIEVQQRTLEYIGSEVHDFVGNRLSLALLYSQDIPETRHQLRTQIEKVINEALVTVKSLSRLKVESVDGDLEELIRNEIEQLKVIRKLDVGFESSLRELKCSSAVINYFVLRILQEFLHNSITHAGCSKINVNLREIDGYLEVSAADNGKGFLTGGPAGKGIGLKTMQKRAELIDATFELSSNPGHGTTMKLSIPKTHLTI